MAKIPKIAPCHLNVRHGLAAGLGHFIAFGSFPSFVRSFGVT